MEAQSDGPRVVCALVCLSQARDMMLEATDTKEAPWYIVRSDESAAPAELYFAPSRSDSLQEDATGQDQAPETLHQGAV